jgi:integrase
MAKPIRLPSGNWQIKYVRPNKTRGSKTFPTWNQANDVNKKFLAMIAEGIDPDEKIKTDQATAKARAITLRQLADEFRESKRVKNGSPIANKYKTELKRYVNLADFADRPIGEITAEEVTKWFNELSQVTGKQASHAYTWIKAVFAEAIDRKLITDNPCRIKSAGSFTTQTELPIPDSKQVAIMYELAQGEMKAYLALAVGGGLRRGEIHELRKKNIQVEDRNGKQVVFIDIKKAVEWPTGSKPQQKATKTSNSVRRIPLGQKDSQIIRDHLATMNTIDPEALLFCSDRKSNSYWAANYAYDKLTRIFAEAGWDGSPHRLRAYAATQYGLQGATLAELMERFGWTNVKTAMRYLRSTGREVELLDRLAQ